LNLRRSVEQHTTCFPIVFIRTLDSHHHCPNQVYELQSGKLTLLGILSCQVVNFKLILFIFMNLWCSTVLICNVENKSFHAIMRTCETRKGVMFCFLLSVLPCHCKNKDQTIAYQEIHLSFCCLEYPTNL
jgi:hypothetical protein